MMPREHERAGNAREVSPSWRSISKAAVDINIISTFVMLTAVHNLRCIAHVVHNAPELCASCAQLVARSPSLVRQSAALVAFCHRQRGAVGCGAAADHRALALAAPWRTQGTLRANAGELPGFQRAAATGGGASSLGRERASGSLGAALTRSQRGRDHENGYFDAILDHGAAPFFHNRYTLRTRGLSHLSTRLSRVLSTSPTMSYGQSGSCTPEPDGLGSSPAREIGHAG